MQSTNESEISFPDQQSARLTGGVPRNLVEKLTHESEEIVAVFRQLCDDGDELGHFAGFLQRVELQATIKESLR